MNLNATILGQAIAFVLFVLFCMKYVWPPLMASIEKRQKEIADGLASAERAKKDLDIAQAEATDHLKQAKVEAQAIIEQANKRKAQVVDEAKAEAEAERNKILAQAQAEIDAERKRAREELRKQVAMLALAGAEKIIERSVDDAANSDIVDKIVAEL
ncbi:ATP synthase subunit b [Sodalis glossinidius str. 'morsitans']|uniref:ATP synthase subunit b n=2 Tax=Sodalis glossinidius (strain morsitans) TaxID=343509 RepID=ATPF_SODGM|nr:F0F1 ATP synthase subunit B [Sodalis glossinidius]Q2NQ90.1 RecName: Full=ATP synthase subunit b; AltName: Full=ATP synthase F(0) sector subunit b; AltName: Full=ATPase subunit I; AltName: Full=F-type ATPase subunit b; Short=F-ATPase subunit b [Sodalis glossinidius str. 'morsitans']BAE75685.1 ATP synthase subunit B [Sodalis glossinidius str. 'morsitans']CRL46777.1 ATP synthase subunit b [Sodalis glossinidius str. 'morsitans']